MRARSACEADDILIRTDALPFDQTSSVVDRSPLDVAGLLSRPIWKELRTFLAVAKSRSFAEAAAMLHTSGPTVSREVKRLEQQLATKLVVSSHSGITLTEAGRALALQLADLDFQLHTLSSNLKRDKADVAGTVTISVTSGLSVAFVAPAVQRLNARFPHIAVDLKDQMSFVDFAKNQAEIMLSMAPLQRGDVTSREVGTLHLIPVAHRRYIETHGVPSLGRLAQHRFLQCSYYTAPGAIWDRWRDLVASGLPAHSAANSLAYYSFAKSGAGVALLGNYVLIDPDFVPIDLNVHVPIRLHLVALTDRLRAPPVRAVFDWLAELFADNPMFAGDLLLQPTHSAPENDFRAFFNLSRS